MPRIISDTELDHAASLFIHFGLRYGARITFAQFIEATPDLRVYYLNLADRRNRMWKHILDNSGFGSRIN